MKRRQLRIVTLGLVGSLMMANSIYGAELDSINDISSLQNFTLASEEIMPLLGQEVAELTSNRLATVNVSVLNVRALPSLNGGKIAQLEYGQEVHIIRQEGEWYFISSGEIQGFVFGEYLTLSTEDNLLSTNTLAKQDIYLDGIITEENSEVMSLPSVDGQVLANFSEGQTVSVLSQHGDWYLVSDEDEAIKGYVASASLQLITEEVVTASEESVQKFAVVNAGTLNVRQSPSIDATIIGKTYRNTYLEVSNILDEWVEINQGDGTTGYVFKTYVTLTNDEPPAVSEISQQIIDYAKQFLGNPYRYGGNSLTNGTDCSGFTKLVFQNFGYNLSRTSRAQINDGVRIDRSQLQPGDLVFYGYNNYISHVAIYIGQDQIIHANTPSTGIIISNINIGKPYIGATRIIN